MQTLPTRINIPLILLPRPEKANSQQESPTTPRGNYFTNEVLSLQELANLFNTAGEGQLYAALSMGLYEYNAPRRELRCLRAGDWRRLCSSDNSDGGDHAPVRLIYSDGEELALERARDYAAKQGWATAENICRNAELANLVGHSKLRVLTVGHAAQWTESTATDYGDYDATKPIRTLHDVRRFAYYIYNKEHLDMHPDDGFESFEDKHTGTRALTTAQAALYNQRLAECWALCTDEEEAANNIYTIFHSEQYVYLLASHALDA